MCVFETPLLCGTQFLTGLVVNPSQVKSLDWPLSHNPHFMKSELAFLQRLTQSNVIYLRQIDYDAVATLLEINILELRIDVMHGL